MLFLQEHSLEPFIYDHLPKYFPFYLHLLKKHNSTPKCNMSEGDKKDFYLVIPYVILDSFHRMELFGS
jgi:hypothetical protein